MLSERLALCAEVRECMFNKLRVPIEQLMENCTQSSARAPVFFAAGIEEKVVDGTRTMSNVSRLVR